MGLKTGLAIGFGVGYWFGAKAGEARYEQLEELAAKVRSSSTFQSTTIKARERLSAAMDDGVAKARIMLADATGGAASAARDPELPFYDQDRER